MSNAVRTFKLQIFEDNTMEKTNCLGYLKYEGELVADGYMDAKKSAQALLGFDHAVRFFISELSPSLKNIDFEFPVRVQKGSWEIDIPKIIELIVISGGGVVATAYGKKAAERMAENDFENLGVKDIFKKSLQAIIWTIKIGKHLGDLSIKTFKKVKFKDENTLVGIPNSNEEYLFVPKDYLALYSSSPPKLLSGVAELIENKRSLQVGVNENDIFFIETITKRYRRIFTQEEEDTPDVLFPELDHGDDVLLEGEITRGNERTNSLGFGYKGHILSCYPQSGSVVKFKHCLFEKCKIWGTISRLQESGGLGAKKPKILFTNIVPIIETDEEPTLF